MAPSRHPLRRANAWRTCALVTLLSACSTTLSPDDASVDAGATGEEDGGTATDAEMESGADAATDAGADAGTADTGTTGTADAGTDAGPPPPPACPRARVNTPGETLNVRPDPSTGSPPVGRLPHDYVVEVVDMVRGQTIDGMDLWFEIRSPIANGFVFATFAVCTNDEIPPDDGNYYMPFACGASHRVTQGPGGSTSHTGRSANAYDFSAPSNTPIHAARAGRVSGVRTTTRPGDPCYNGGGRECVGAINWIILQHPDGETSAYFHINSTSMSVGTEVRRGDVIAASGSTGWSTGPHVHFEVRGGCPNNNSCQTIPFSMADIGRPLPPNAVTSGNCP